MVAILGASSAGLICAYVLAKANVPVELFEAQQQYDPEERTLIATQALNDLIDFDFSESVLNYIHGFRIHTKNQMLTILISKPDIVLERRTFLKLLFRNAHSAGANLHLGYDVREVRSHGNHVEVTIEKDRKFQKLVFRYAIIANGVRSTQLFPEIRMCYKTVAISQVRVHMPDCGHKHIVDIWFDVEKTKFFYWFIPEGEKSGVVGVIADTQDETERILEDFVNKHRIKVIERQKGEIVPIPSVRMPHKDKKKKRILFAGDSCAQVKATTVGGLVSGLKGGIACARSILAGRPVDEFLKPLKKELLVHVIARRILHLFEDEDYDHLIRILNPKFMSILRSHTRDELSKIVLKLFVAQPKLLGVVTKAILRRIFL